MLQGLFLTQYHNFYPLEIEGDSQILIDMATRLQAGSFATKLAKSWRLALCINLLK